MNWFKKVVFENYINFDGRARRSEYWYFILFNAIFALIFATVSSKLYFVYVIAIILPSLAVAVRRLHDIGKSGVWLFISFVPIIGGIWLLVLLATQGDSDYNEFGSDPKEMEY
jgi:uncharacterized membrane protein YhaH (DUF805 family)|tara:strand:+ start:202 stop:540 length:339 start_codon:yes stop_codon:yes gene_type:complete